MTTELRPFQADLYARIVNSWLAGNVNVMAVAPTGAGKTVVISHAMNDESGHSVAVAHRQELVSQISMALARNGLEHRIVGNAAGKASKLLSVISAMQTYEFGRPYLNQHARAAVAGVNTLAKHSGSDPWFRKVRLQIHDESHHVLQGNTWGRVAELFPHARGLFPTATPCRADGKGLGRHAHGIIDDMQLAPSMRDIINAGYLTDYRVAVPPNSNFHRENLHVSQSTGEFIREEVVAEVKRAQIVGDVVNSYLKFAPGKRGVTFCVDVEEAERQAEAFRGAGVPAVALSANTPDAERHRELQRLKRGEILQVTNVDLFGEGFDLPAIEVVSFARPTQSLNLYIQQFGRVLRLMLTPEELRGYNDLSDAGRRAVIAASGKPYGLVIDHVGNIQAHGLPDKPRTWSLDARERGGSGSGRLVDDVPMRVCANVMCLAPYERILAACPYCGEAAPLPQGRSKPEQVDGDLTLLDEAALAAMRGEIAKIDGPCYPPHGVPDYVARSILKRHNERQAAQKDLRAAIAWWAGYQSAIGATDSESYRRFWFRYGIDVAGAQTLGRGEAEELAQRIHADLRAVGVIADATL